MSEDLNKQRLIVKKLVRAEFKHAWEFRIEFDNQPKDFDIFVKEITYGPTEISTEPENVGSRVITWPVRAEPVSLSMTVRDYIDERIGKWFDQLAGKVVNSDGTVNLPYGDGGYVLKCRRYSLIENEDGSPSDEWEMYPTKRGDVTESIEEPGFLEYPVSFIQFRS